MANKKQTKKNQNKPASSADALLEMKNLLQRTQASFENYRKQTEKRIAEIQEMAARNTLVQILPIVDNFSLALKSADTNSNPDDFLQGVELIYSQLNGVLEDSGVKPIATENKVFDPHVHEALMKVESDLPENAIIEEFQKGFTLHGKVIRHARVKISAGQPAKENKESETKMDAQLKTDLKTELNTQSEEN